MYESKDLLNHYRPPAALCRVVSAAVSDLYNGPLYLTAAGDECSMFDSDYHHAFDFSRAVSIVGAWIDNQNTGYWDSDAGMFTTALPEDMPCDSCDGIGSDELGDSCGECNGAAFWPAEYSDYYEIDREAFTGGPLG